MKRILISLTAIALIIMASSLGHAASLAEGTTLYATNCEGCHNPLATSEKKGATVASTQNAIAGNKGGMGYLSFLTLDQLTSISIALGGAPAPTPTPVPSITLTSAVSGSTVNLSWTVANLTGVSSYSILRNGVSVGTAAAAALSYANTGLANGTYSYQVRALSSTSAVLATSNTVSATVNVAPVPVPSVTLASAVSGSTVSLSWTVANLTGVSSYSILRNGVSVGTAAAAALSYANTGLANGTYSYQVRALNSTSAVLATSNTVSATVNVAPAPVPSITLTSAVSGSTVNLSWTIANLTGVSSYNVLRSGVKVGTATAVALSYANTGLANGTYTFEVDAVSSTGAILAKSNVVSATVNVAPAPVPSITLTSTVSGSTVNLSWTIANMTGVSSYQVMRSGMAMGTSTSTGYADMGMANGTYSYQVRALSSTSAVLATSNTVSATVNVAPAPVPVPSVTLTSTVSGSTVNLSWTIANMTGVSSYQVMRGGMAMGTSTSTGYADMGMANGTYSYQVRALSSTSAVLATSNVVSATVNVAPAPVPDTSITLTSSVLGKKVTLNWTKANVAGVARYKIMRNGVRIAATTALSYTNYGLANGTYSYEVDAVNMYGKVLARSNAVSATVNVIPTVTLTSSVSGNTVTLKWTKSYLASAARYKIMRNGVRMGAATIMSYTNSGLANGTYSYEVDAVNMYGKVLARSNVVSATVNVAPAPAPTPVPTDGATLYGTKCSGCHGPLATSNVKGKSAQLMQNAINNNLGGMGTLKSLTAAQVSSIADALAVAPAPAPTPAPAPAPQPVIDGAALYESSCAGCHKPLASSNVMGKSASEIKSAITGNKGGMGSLRLTDEQIKAIGATLTSGFDRTECTSCHTSDGKLK